MKKLRNEEARKYENVILYEEIRDYLASQSTAMANLMLQQINQAFEKAHRPPQVTLNERANAFFKQYSKYKDLNYPSLQLRTKDTANGYWAHYSTRFGKSHILHKIKDGYVDLTINKAGNQLEYISMIADWADKHSSFKIAPVEFGKSAGLRIQVPSLDMQLEFDSVSEDELRFCFDAIKELSELAGIMETIHKLQV